MVKLFNSQNVAITSRYSMVDKLIFLLYSSYFILFPFYFWRSGIPQVADFIIILVFIIHFTTNGFKLFFLPRTKTLNIIGLVFVFHIFLVNFSWMIIFNRINTMGIVSIFYLYNFLNSMLLTSLYTKYKHKILSVIFRSVVLSILLQMLIFISSGGFTGGRMTQSFNNPNQLGYYTILTTSILLFLDNKIKINRVIIYIVLFFNLLLVLASLSSTAILSYIMLMFFYALSGIQNYSIKKVIKLIPLSFLVASLIFTNIANSTQKSNIIKSIQSRAERTESKIRNFVEERGYNRISEHPEFWIFGSGEGEYLARFNSRLEFHSTIGNIQVSYGILGTILLIVIILKALINDKYKSWFIVVSILIYGLTHNGIRNSLFWVLLALIACGIDDYSNE